MAIRTAGSSAPHDREHYFGGFVSDSPRTTTVSAKVRDWVRTHRPTEAAIGRPWFVILCAVFLGLALLTSTGLFVFGALVSAGLAWWRRESARAGLAQVAFWAFALGLGTVLLAIVFYFIPGFPIH